MAPAMIAGVQARVQARVVWDRDAVINAIREWVATYGEPPRAADWNPSSAKWAGQTWRIERYRAGRADGSPWPALNSAKRPFGGSLNAAIRAAGLRPARPGPKRRSDVQPAQADRVQMDPEARALLMTARAQARVAVKRVAALEARLERERERATRLTAERDAARVARRPVKPKVQRVVDGAATARAVKRVEAAEARAQAAVREAKERQDTARMDAAEARQMAGRLAGIIRTHPLAEDILESHRHRANGDDAGYDGYKAHVYRVINLARALTPETPDRDHKLAIAASFHDLAAFETLDYLAPSIEAQDVWLKASGREAWGDELAIIVAEHHRLTKYKGGHATLAEAFRRADLVDVSMGLIRFGIPRDHVREVRRSFDASVFFKRVVPKAALKGLKKPQNPLPFVRARNALARSGHEGADR